MRTRELVPLLLSATALGLGLAACGTSSPAALNVSAATAGPSQAHHAAPVRIPLAGPISVAGNGPVSTVIMIDRTTLIAGDRPLALSYRQAALDTAAPTIQRGGSLSVVVFGRVAAQDLPLYSVEIPTLSQAGPASRNDAGQAAALTHVLDIALGLARAPNVTDQRKLASITRHEGSDIGGAVAQAITTLSSDPTAVRDALVLTDGEIIQQAQPQLMHVLSKHGPSQAAQQILSDIPLPRRSRTITLLQIAGLAANSSASDPGVKTVRALERSWQLACDRLPVRQCDATAQL